MDRACELAWVAGFFEGEGTAGRYGRVPVLRVASTDLDRLEHLQEILGFGGICADRYSDKYPKHWKLKWQWQAHSLGHVQWFAAYIGPMLGPRRQAQVEEAAGVSIAVAVRYIAS